LSIRHAENATTLPESRPGRGRIRIWFFGLALDDYECGQDDVRIGQDQIGPSQLWQSDKLLAVFDSRLPHLKIRLHLFENDQF
jgi:hypothetical protein